MKYQTRDFGEIDVAPENMVEFRQPLYGYEGFHKFTLLYDEAVGEQISWLQSLEDPGLCFIVMDPHAAVPNYAPRLPADIDRLVGAGELHCFVTAAVHDDPAQTTLNLKSPIILNVETRLAAQIILEQAYPLRFPLSGRPTQGAGGAEC